MESTYTRISCQKNAQNTLPNHEMSKEILRISVQLCKSIHKYITQISSLSTIIINQTRSKDYLCFGLIQIENLEDIHYKVFLQSLFLRQQVQESFEFLCPRTSHHSFGFALNIEFLVQVCLSKLLIALQRHQPFGNQTHNWKTYCHLSSFFKMNLRMFNSYFIFSHTLFTFQAPRPRNAGRL